MDKSYTASERRGIIALAFISLLIIGAGIGVTYFNGKNKTFQEPVVTIIQEMADTITMNDFGTKSEKGPSRKSVNTNKRDGSANTNKNSKEKKTYRRRNPIDEPV